MLLWPTVLRLLGPGRVSARRARPWARRHASEAEPGHATMGDILHHGTGAGAKRQRHTAALAEECLTVAVRGVS
jgi:hypothetical protein